MSLNSILLHSIHLLLERFDESRSSIFEELRMERVDFLPDEFLFERKEEPARGEEKNERGQLPFRLDSNATKDRTTPSREEGKKRLKNER